MKHQATKHTKPEPGDEGKQVPRLKAQRLHELDMDYRRHTRRLRQIVQLFKSHRSRTTDSHDT